MTKNDFYRYCRIVHGWLSAVAFIFLCFFAFTGIMLNHPGWLTGSAPAAAEKKFKLSSEELDEIRSSRSKPETLAQVASKHVDVRGDFSDGDKVGSDLFVRLQGVRGLTDIRGNMLTGNVTVVIEAAAPGAIFNELHRAEHAGTAWRWLVDVFGVLLIVMSIVGYLIFLSLRFRLRTALILTAASIVGLVSLFVIAIP